MDPRVKNVLDTFGQILASDGGSLELLNIADGVARVRYVPGNNEECPECVMTPEGLRGLLLEALQTQAPYIKELELAT